MADPPRRELGEVAAGRDPHAGEGGTVAAAVGRHERRGEEGRGGGQRAAERSSLMLSRTLRVLDRDANAQPRGGNRVTSTRFTWWNFVFLFLYEQFDPRHKFANFYFLVICVLQSLDSISITNGYPVCLNALAFVVLVQFVLTLKETISRCSNDRSTNSRPVSLYDTESNELKPGTWGDVLVGDIVKVTQGSFFPADLVLIATSPSASDDAVASSLGGCCFINTQNLDGETNHKIRKTPQVPLSVVADTGYGDDQDGGADRSDEHANGVAEAMEVAIRTWEDAELRCEAYNSRTTEFTATARFSTTSQSAASETVPLSIENLLLRGCVLVDAEWVLGIAVAVGGTAKCNFREEDGDASAKSCCPQVGGRKGKDSMKVASVHAFINRQIAWFIVMLVGMCVWGTIGWYMDLVVASENGSVFWYLGDSVDNSMSFDVVNGTAAQLPSWLEAVKQFFRFFLLNYQLIPVSLYVSLNLISLWQQFFMVRDAQMYSAADGGQRCRVSTMELNDELGLVTHLLTDKTGTLTQNSMRLCGLYAYGRAYGSFGNANEASPGHLQTKFLNFVDGARYSLSNDLGANCQPHSRVALAVTTDAAPVHVARSTALTLLGINMAVNHSLQLQHNKFRCSDVDGGAGDTPVHQEIDALEHTLVGVSQDEKAFVVAATATLGVRFVSRDAASNTITLIVQNCPSSSGEDVQSGVEGRKITLRVIETFDYTTARKRMGCIVEDTEGESGELAKLTGGASHMVFVKGADTALKDLLQPQSPATPASEEFPNTDMKLRDLEAQLKAWGRRCFRSLVFAFKPLAASSIGSWMERYRLALTDDIALAARAAGDSHNPISELIAEMESGLFLQGATACEDELQENVPATIATLRRAGIRVWMLTGDRVDTACNIARSCGLLAQQVTGRSPSSGLRRNAEENEPTSNEETRFSPSSGPTSEQKHSGDVDTANQPHLQPSVACGGEHAQLLQRHATNVENSGSDIVFLTSDEAEKNVALDEDVQERSIYVRPLREVSSVELVDAGVAYDEAVAASTTASRKSIDILLSDDTRATCRNCAALSSLRETLHLVAESSQSQNPVRRQSKALVIDEKSADYILASKTLRTTFLKAAERCETVLACRIRKEQKAQLVLALREYRSSNRRRQKCGRRWFGGCICCDRVDHAVTRIQESHVSAICSIGDGANDVAMIRAADVGVGVVGKEGREAANTADFGIARFHFLQQLLLVHGRYNAYRTAKVVPFIFYKNLANVLTQFLFQFWTRWSGKSMFPVGSLCKQPSSSRV
eukprot:INCI19286.1.p1 GENE.INCI19286.1~~INCI19286.1.p1  ORF type:complete len:1336 (+),score=247.06 INCI19286.1:171-4010(+)